MSDAIMHWSPIATDTSKGSTYRRSERSTGTVKTRKKTDNTSITVKLFLHLAETGVISLTKAIDMSQVLVDSVRVNDKSVQLQHRLALPVSFEDGLLTVHDFRYGISCYANDMRSLQRDVLEQLEFNIEEYVLDVGALLTRDALELRQNLSELLGGHD